MEAILGMLLCQVQLRPRVLVLREQRRGQGAGSGCVMRHAAFYHTSLNGLAYQRLDFLGHGGCSPESHDHIAHARRRRDGG
eukprot:COSAG06_NODE_9818_length_1809_cov_2.678947_5_plen_81_part_00